MKTFKKLFSVSAIVALLGTLAPMYAFGATYDTELTNAYEYAHAKGITTMSSIDNADMYGNLSRIAMAKMIANFATTVLGLEPDTSAKCTFTDVTASLDAQYDNGVTNACQLGLMGQNITAFRPNDPVTRGEFGTTLSRALNANSDDLAAMNAADPFYKEHLNFLKEEGIMNNISNPNQVEVRGYVMLMMMRADDSYTPATAGCSAEELLACITADDYDACIAACSDAEEEEEDLPGYATVSTKAAAAQTVALNAVDKKIGTVTLKAGENDSTVTNIEITKSGLGQRADILNVQLMKNGEYVTDGKAFGSDNTAKLRFRPNLTLKANSSETFDVVVSMAGKGTAEPNGQHEFSVTAVTVANGTFGGTPAKLGSLTTTNYTIPAITIDSITAGGNYDAGDEDRNIVSIDLSTTVNATINSLTITSRDDELDKAFANAKAYIDDVEVGTVTVNDETIVVEGLNKEITKSDTVSIDIKADVIFVGPSAPATTFRLYVDDNHINATESNTNERMTSAKTADANVSVKGVELTMTKVIKDTQTVAPGTNVKLLSLKLESKTDLEVSDYYVTFPTGFPFANFEDGEVTLYVDGIDYTITGGSLNLDTDSDTVNDAYQLSTKNDRFSVSSNNSVNVTLEGKLIKNAPDFTVTSDSIKFYVAEVKNLENNKDIDGLTVNKGCHTTKVSAGSYTVTKPATMPTNKTVIAGAESDVLFFNLKASTENLILKEVDIYSAAKFNTFATEVSLMQGNTVVKTFDDEDAELNANTITFDKLTKNLNKDSTVPFTVRVTVKDGEVTTLGSSFKVDLTRVRTARSATPSVTTDKTTGLIAGNTYQITSNIPSIALTAKAGKDTTIEFTNDSAYNVVLNSIKFEVTQNKVDGDYADIAGKVTLLDTIGGSVVAKTTGGTPAVKRVGTYDATTEMATAATAKFDEIHDAINAAKGTWTLGGSNPTVTLQSGANGAATATTLVIGGYTLTLTTTGDNSNKAVYTYDATADMATASSTKWSDVKATVVDGTYVYTYDEDNHVITATQKVAANNDAATTTINTKVFTKQTNGVAGVEGTIAGATVPGTVTITFADEINTVDNSPLTRVIELLGTSNTITDADYTITIKELNFNYVDGANMSQSIVETYNVSK